MFPLDPKTMERVARIVVDADGPYERRGRELEQLLRNAGWDDVPPYDGAPRVPWLADQLTERADDRAAIERLLCRACDPLEYDDGSPSAEAFRTALNEVLHAEQLTVSVVGGRPVMGELGGGDGRLTFSEPPDLENRLRRLLHDQRTADVLAKRAAETRIAERGGAYTLAVIGIGSLVEGLLLALLLERDENLRENGLCDENGRRVRPDRAGMQLLIDIAYGKSWIQLDARGFMHTVRDFRNFIHPRKELDEVPEFDADSVRLCWAPVHAVLNDLEERLG